MNKLILGTVQMGIDYGINNSKGKVSKQKSLEILNTAYDSSIQILDTAEVYGNAHEIIGEFHKINPNKKFDIITKIPAQSKNITSKINSYLHELNVSIIFTLMFHSFETLLASPFLLEELVQLKKEKIIQKIGVSVYTNEQIEKILEFPEIEVVQLPFNLFDNKSLRGESINKLKKHGKLVHTRSAFLQGLFFVDPNTSGNIIANKLQKDLQKLNYLAKKENCTMSELALSYCISIDQIDGVLFGVDSLQQLNENLHASNYQLSTLTIDEINSILIQNTDLLNPNLWKSLIQS